MKKSSTDKISKLVILDANIVIHLFELGLWDKVIEKLPIVLADTVVVDESLYIEDPQTLRKTPLNLEKNYVSTGKIQKKSLKATTTSTTVSTLKSRGAPQIDPGETESLAIIFSDNSDKYQLCTADKAAITCMVFLGIEDRAVSLEKILKTIEIYIACPSQYTEAALRNNIENGYKSLTNDFTP